MNAIRRPLTARQLRMVQIGCLVLAVSALWLVAHPAEPKNNAEFGPIQWAIALAGIYSAVFGFTSQRFFNKKRPQSRPSGPGSASYRWSIGHLMRLATACTVAIWGAVTAMFKGPLWMAYGFCGLGILLVLVWTPGTPPPDRSDALT